MNSPSSLKKNKGLGMGKKARETLVPGAYRLLPDALDSTLERIISHFKHASDDTQLSVHSLEVHGSWGSAPRLIAALLNNAMARPIMLVTAHIPTADEAQDDLETWFRTVPARREQTQNKAIFHIGHYNYDN